MIVIIKMLRMFYVKKCLKLGGIVIIIIIIIINTTCKHMARSFKNQFPPS